MGTEQRELFINLVYQLRDFSEQELIDKLSDQNVRINNFFVFHEYLSSLQEIGTLNYNGQRYKVVPAEERLIYRRFSLRACTY